MWSVFLAAAILVPICAFSAGDYYVNPDPSLASDDYDGTAAEWAGGDSKVGPKLTLAGAMGISTLRSGDTVHAAAGEYALGEMYDSNAGSNRVVVKGGVMLIGAGADTTTIRGKLASGTENGIGPDALRAVYMLQYSVIQGFTITDGRTESTADSNKNRGGGINGTGGLVADCRIVGNGCGHRGTAVNGGNTLLRCYIGDNSIGTYGLYSGTKLIDCVYDCSQAPYSSIYAYNCLFKKSIPQGGSSSYSKAYNCIVLNQEGWYTDLLNCRLARKRRTNETTADEYTKDNISGLEQSFDSQTFRPVAGSELIDAGKDSYYALATNAWQATWLGFAGKDYAGRVRKVGSSIDIGPGEYAWIDGVPTGLTAQVENASGGMKRVIISRNFDSEKLCTGFVFGDSAVEFDKDGIGGAWTNQMPADLLWSLPLSAIYATGPAHWYVNPDPLKGNDANRGYHRDCPKLRLDTAAALAASGDVIHAAEGVYNEGGRLYGETMTRVILGAGVGLVSDAGADKTVIEGVLSDEPGRSGPDSVRCVSMGSGAYVKGFTIRNGSTRVGSSNVYGENGGGVAGSGAAIDCIITNCYGVRGGGTYQATLIRCRLDNCYEAQGATNANGTVASTAGAGMHMGNAYDSYINSAMFNVVEVRNSWCLNVWDNSAGDGYCRVYNSYVAADYGSVAYTNCILASGLRATCVADGKTLFNTRISLDENLRPLSADAVQVDRGAAEYYVYPAAFAHESGKDIAGGQRIYNNGKIDIGPGEYDWRDVFAQSLNRKYVAVDAASETVMVADAGGLRLVEGDSLRLSLVFRTAGTCSFVVETAAGGTVKVVADDVELAPSGNVYSLTGTKDGVRSVSILCESGNAVVKDLNLPGVGIVVIFK